MRTLSSINCWFMIFICLACNFAGCATRQSHVKVGRNHNNSAYAHADSTKPPKHQQQLDYFDNPQEDASTREDYSISSRTSNVPTEEVTQNSKSLQTHEVIPDENKTVNTHENNVTVPDNNNEFSQTPSNIKTDNTTTQIPNILDNQGNLKTVETPQSTQQPENLQELDHHTLPAVEKSEEREWIKPRTRQPVNDELPPAPPLDLIPDSNTHLQNIWSVGWQKNLFGSKSLKGSSNNRIDTNPKTSTSNEESNNSSKQPTEFKKLTLIKPSSMFPEKNKASTGYFPPAGSFPNVQSEADIAAYPRPKSGLVTLAKPEFNFADELVVAQELPQYQIDESKSSYYPPQKIGFREFPEYSSTWK